MGMVIAPAWLRQVTPPLLHITTLTTAKNLVFPPKNLSIFCIWAYLTHCYKKLAIKLLFNFNNFNSRLPASSQHHIKYFNPKKAHPCVIPRILSHHASKSVKTFDVCAAARA